MSDNSKISWTEATWNPTRGCALVSTGCKNCYAMKVAHRFSGEGGTFEGLTELGPQGPRWIGRAMFVPGKLAEPMTWRRGRKIFVDSMSDLFHEDITFEQVAAVFGVMAACPRHTFQVLTKRPERALAFFGRIGGQNPLRKCGDAAEEYGSPVYVVNKSTGRSPWNDTAGWPLPNVHLGVSCEDQATADERVPLLLQCPAAVRWVSAEPLLGSIRLVHWNGENHLGTDGTGISWVVVGGESGANRRPMDLGWLLSVVGQCKAAGVPVFVKQDSAATPGQQGVIPDAFWLKEFPLK